MLTFIAILLIAVNYYYAAVVSYDCITLGLGLVNIELNSASAAKHTCNIKRSLKYVIMQ